MAFTVEDFQDLLRLLEQRPDWRAELRRHVLDGELLELPAIVGQLGVGMDQLTDRMDQLAGRMDELAQAQKALTTQMAGLADQMAVMVDRVGKMGDRVGSVEGELLELRYERHAAAYFSRLARKLRVVDPSRVADMLDDAVDAGRLAEAERDAVMEADLVLSGKRREDRADVYFVVEVSVGIGLDDVSRAVERARALTKIGQTALPVVAGHWINHEAEAAARDLGVVQILDGRARRPEA
jgi:hypothetical protein